MKKIFISLCILLCFVFLSSSASAHSGCCSHHGGVCGCGCCDGTPLSNTCAPYYPECNNSSPQSTTTNSSNSNTTTYTAPAYVAPTNTPVPPTATPIPPTNTPTPSPMPTVTPTKAPTKQPTKMPTILPTAAVLGASTQTNDGNALVGFIVLLVLLGLFAAFCFGAYKLSRRLWKYIKGNYFSNKINK